MKRLIIIPTLLLLFNMGAKAQVSTAVDTSSAMMLDTVIKLREASCYVFKNKDDELEYVKDIQRIRTMMPYVKMARHLYAQVEEKKDAGNKKEYRHFRKDTEKEMRDRFEKELRDKTINEGKVLVKLLNRETGNNCYKIIKEIKGGFSAWTWQIVAKHYTYDLKEAYDPHKEWILEMAIRYLGPEYNPN